MSFPASPEVVAKCKVGTRYGSLVVSGESYLKDHLSERTGKNDRFRVIPCNCDCGETSEPTVQNLVRGKTNSCGCQNVAATKARATTHGGSGTRLHRIWKAMKYRCHYEGDSAYRYYGARGIHVCDEWREDFAAFRDWSEANGYRQGLSLDREDNDAGYSPWNCRWATAKEQARNTSANRLVTVFGDTKCLSEWVEDVRCVVDDGTLRYRLNNNWIPEDAISTPINRIGEIALGLRSEMASSSLDLSDQEIEMERWLTIPGWERYQASDYGRVRNASRAKPKILKPSQHPKTRKLYVTIFRDHPTKPYESSKFYVDRLVLMAHVGPQPDGMESCHFPDPEPSNCRLANLRWDTRSENIKDKSRLNALLLKMVAD